MAGTLRTLSCATCRKACCVESVEGEYQDESQMPPAPNIVCFDCAAEMVAKVTGTPPGLINLGVAMCRSLGVLNSPAASLARETLKYVGDHFANRHDCWTCKSKTRTLARAGGARQRDSA